MSNTIQPILETLIGGYQYGLHVASNGYVYVGLNGLDWAYFGRFIILCISLIMVYSLFNKLIVRMFGVWK